MGADTRLNAQENRRLPLPKPPLPNPLEHVLKPKVRFSIDDRAPSINSGGSAYQLGAHTLSHKQQPTVLIRATIMAVRLHCHTCSQAQGVNFAAAGGGKATDMVVSEFHKALARSPETAVAVAAIKVTSAAQTADV